MNRRRFLQNLGIVAGLLTVDPEKLLWVPGQKRIFIPPVNPPVVLSNLDLINTMTLKYIRDARLVEQVFKMSPLTAYWNVLRTNHPETY